MLHSLYPAYILTITNVSPYLKNLSVVSSTKLVHLFSQFTSPGFLLAEEGNHRLVEHMLEAFNNIVQYQFAGLFLYLFLGGSSICNLKYKPN